MTNKENRLEKLKYELRQKKANGVERVIWKLDEEQSEYVERLGYEKRPYMYEVTTKVIPDMGRGTHPLIRDISIAKKQGRNKLYLKLKTRELQELDERDIKYCPLKYEIILQ